MQIKFLDYGPIEFKKTHIYIYIINVGSFDGRNKLHINSIRKVPQGKPHVQCHFYTLETLSTLNTIKLPCRHLNQYAFWFSINRKILVCMQVCISLSLFRCYLSIAVEGFRCPVRVYAKMSRTLFSGGKHSCLLRCHSRVWTPYPFLWSFGTVLSRRGDLAGGRR